MMSRRRTEFWERRREREEDDDEVFSKRMSEKWVRETRGPVLSHESIIEGIIEDNNKMRLSKRNKQQKILRLVGDTRKHTLCMHTFNMWIFYTYLCRKFTLPCFPISSWTKKCVFWHTQYGILKLESFLSKKPRKYHKRDNFFCFLVATRQRKRAVPLFLLWGSFHAFFWNFTPESFEAQGSCNKEWGQWRNFVGWFDQWLKFYIIERDISLKNSSHNFSRSCLFQ